MELTLRDRAASYARAFPQWPGSWLTVIGEQDREVLQGVWMFGQDYRNKSGYYGAYPGNYLDRLAALFPDFTIHPGTLAFESFPVLHAFSGSLGSGPYWRCDIKQQAEFNCDVVDLPAAVVASGVGPFGLIVADPPYTSEDAKKYGTAMVQRLAVTSVLSKVALPGAFLAWLDTTWPMHSKAEWVTVGRIYIQRSTNHRVRLLSLFQRA